MAQLVTVTNFIMSPLGLYIMFLKTLRRRHPLLLVTLVLAGLYLTADMYMSVDMLDWVMRALSIFDNLKAHEIIQLALFIVLAAAIDQYRNAVRSRFERQLDRDRVRVVQSTMSTVQDIVNNALNNLVFIQIEAEKSAALSRETLQTFDTIITGTAEKLKDIRELEHVSERALGSDIHSLKVG